MFNLTKYFLPYVRIVFSGCDQVIWEFYLQNLFINFQILAISSWLSQKEPHLGEDGKMMMWKEGLLVYKRPSEEGNEVEKNVFIWGI